jgi:hypothetical protein
VPTRYNAVLIYDLRGLGTQDPACFGCLALGLFLSKALGSRFRGAIVNGGNHLLVITPIGSSFLCVRLPV